MSGTLHILWTIASADQPRLLLHCSRCGGERGFSSSGRFRLNANGKKLDAWLVYRCVVCGDSHNRVVFERRGRNEVAPELIDALHRNDPALARRIACDLSGNGRRASGFEAASEVIVAKRLLRPVPATAARLVIRIAGDGQAAMRADRLLARELGLSRGGIDALARSGSLVVAGAGSKALTRPLHDGAVVGIDLSGRADAGDIARRAAGTAPD